MPSGGYGGGGGGATLTQAQREQLFRHQAAVAELLRHFWACFPVLSPQLEEKVGLVGGASGGSHSDTVIGHTHPGAADGAVSAGVSGCSAVRAGG